MRLAQQLFTHALLSLGIVLGGVGFGDNFAITCQAAMKKPPAASTPEKEEAAVDETVVAEKDQVDPNADPVTQARELYGEGVDLFKIAQSQADKGNKAGQRQLLKESIRRFESALKLQPSLVEAQSNIGFAYLTMLDYRDAIRAFEKALEIDPNHLNTLNGLATTYAFEKKIESALETFEKLTTLDPGNPQFFFNKGSILQRIGRPEEAQAAYTEALRLDPKDQRTLFNLATLFENQGELQQALTYYTKAKSVAISSPIGLEAVRRLEFIKANMKDASTALPLMGEKVQLTSEDEPTSLPSTAETEEEP
jgi:tetratricopeptide (TPR) repeat protein